MTIQPHFLFFQVVDALQVDVVAAGRFDADGAFHFELLGSRLTAR